MCVPCISNKMPRELPPPSSFHTQLICTPPPCHCLPFPSSRNVLLDAHPKPFYFKSIPLPLPQEAFSHRNITKADVQPCTWVPALRGCEFTYLVRGSQSTFLESGSVLGSSAAQLPKINTDSGHITRGIPRLGKEKTFAPWTSQSQSECHGCPGTVQGEGCGQLACVLGSAGRMGKTACKGG